MTKDDAWPPAPPLIVPHEEPGDGLPASITVERDQPGRWRCTFFFMPTPDVRQIHLAGSFNNWSATANPLRGPRGDGYWYTELELPPGTHAYKFVVDGDRWLEDPVNPDREDDRQGGVNSRLRLGKAAFLAESTASRGDGQIDVAGLEHLPDRALYFQPLTLDRVLLRLRTFANDVERVFIAVKGQPPVEMHRARQDELFELYEATVELPPLPPDRTTRAIEYTFLLEDGRFRATTPLKYVLDYDADDLFETPVWSHHAVWYQVMLDRFRNGNPDNDPDPVHPWTSEWFKQQPWEGTDGQTFYHHFVFDRLYGGDLDGLEQQLDYLADLGVNALYLNPVFIGESHHKYNATNYLHIDPGFGAPDDDYDAIAATEDLTDPSTWGWTKSDRRFLAFLQTAKKRGFRVIIDAVFNHVGTQHPAFQDILQHRQHSRYADWFNVTSWEPFHYTGWGGFDGLPEFRKTHDDIASPSAKLHVMEVTRRWLAPDGDVSAGVDGWRLDVPNELPHEFWIEWRRHVKTINPDAYIVGEIWDRADLWLDGHHFDAVMNYQLAQAILRWIAFKDMKITPTQFDRWLQELRLAYPWTATLAMQNLMNSHDTDRLASMIHNPDRDYDMGNRIQDNGPDYDPSKPTPIEYQRARLIALFQQTYVGAPMIYYGDEVGMWGPDDPSCRKPMLWKDLAPYENPAENFVDEDHLAFYRQAVHLRRDHPALRVGGFQTLLTDDENDVYAFLRTTTDEQLIVVLNAAERQRKVKIHVPPLGAKRWQAVFGPDKSYLVRQEHLTVEIPRINGVVLKAVVKS